MKLAERHPTDFWGRDARNAAREESLTERTQRELANALIRQKERHHPDRKPVVRCPSCQEPGFVGSTCGCGWQL